MKERKYGCDVDRCFLCRLCLKEWLPAIANNRKNFTVKKGEMIFKEGDEVKGIFFVYEGLVKVHKHWDADKELILRFARKGDIVGHRGLGSDMFYPVSGTALEPVTVCFIDLEFFKASLKVNYDFIYELMMFYARELKDSERNMRNLAHMSVKGRIANALLLLHKKFGTTESGAIDLSISRQDLASFAGTTYETVFRILNEFINDQLIETNGKDIHITDLENLNLLIKQ